MTGDALDGINGKVEFVSTHNKPDKGEGDKPIKSKAIDFNKTNSWKVFQIPNIGKVLVATRDIQPWEKVIDDNALITAPTNTPVCLGCLGEVSGAVVCVRCKWPMCREECQEEKSHQ